MVERELAACVNILAPCTSIYRFEGQVAEAREVPALFKTRADLAGPLIAAIAAAHSYRTPAIVAWFDDACHPATASWVEAETGAGN